VDLTVVQGDYNYDSLEQN